MSEWYSPGHQPEMPEQKTPADDRVLWTLAMGYRGVVVWNKTRKRNSWGQATRQTRPSRGWLRAPAPDWRIVPEALWEAAHARLEKAREVYLRGTHGQLWGRPPRGDYCKFRAASTRGKCRGRMRAGCILPAAGSHPTL